MYANHIYAYIRVYTGGGVRALAVGERGQFPPVRDSTVRPRSARGARAGRNRPGRGYRRDPAQVSRSVPRESQVSQVSLENRSRQADNTIKSVRGACRRFIPPIN